MSTETIDEARLEAFMGPALGDLSAQTRVRRAAETPNNLILEARP
jgi:hypothetical protein